MKPLPPSWFRQIELARREPVPPVDLPALLRVALSAVPTVAGWRFEFVHVFASRPVLSGCVAAATILLAVAGWQAWVFWHDVLPWAQLIANEGMLAGGLS